MTARRAASPKSATATVTAAVMAMLIAALASACASSKPRVVDFSETPRGYTEKDYEDAYDRWTRHDRAFTDVDAAIDIALEVWATYKSWDFREAYIERYASLYGLNDTDRENLRKAQLDAVHKVYEFQVTAQSTSFRWNDLEKANSAWRVALVDGLGHELAPDAIKLEKFPDAYERGFFPAKTAFTKTYTIRFQAPTGADSEFAGPRSGSITLRFNSPIGHVQPTWRSEN
jgi:hypothetical protein